MTTSLRPYQRAVLDTAVNADRVVVIRRVGSMGKSAPWWLGVNMTLEVEAAAAFACLTRRVQRAALVLPEPPPPMQFPVENNGTLKVSKNERTKGAHPQPHYHKGRW